MRGQLRAGFTAAAYAAGDGQDQFVGNGANSVARLLTI